ncbi:MAG: DNA primase [Bacteroidia bacterium]|nr:DNA primase [Bacteroidia bacterium]
MISKNTIARIFETARVEEVIADFVSLKKRGANMIGLCPFHNEKTPSFHVSPSKGIYKCFGCGKAGNAVNFIMDHESLSFPEALRFLASKYSIEVEEDRVETPEEVKQRQAEEEERESLMVVSSFAQKHFTKNLWETEEGKNIGLAYFEERGFRKDIIEKFQLGYSIDQWREFSDAALKAGYQLEFLEKTGLTIVKRPEGGATATENAPASFFDRFMGRVMFPIHNVTGRVIAFGGRTLSADKKTAKYINSPESPIYYKTKVLYGLYFSKTAISREDECFLVEGYTDVISLHQAGISNVVASSGTSLTVEQIRAIRRYTKNITILYDGDPAGIKASFRGINLVLEEGMNVRVLLFPDGDDPDSYSRKVSSDEFRRFIREHTQDFISFKTKLLYNDIQGDPIKKAELIKDIVESIALIPEQITRSVYIKACSNVMDVAEQTLLNELNKIRRKKLDEKRKTEENFQPDLGTASVVPVQVDDRPLYPDSQESQEKDLIRILLNFGREVIATEDQDIDGNPAMISVSIAQYILDSVNLDEVDGMRIEFEVSAYRKIFEEYNRCFNEALIPEPSHFTQNADAAISSAAIDLLTSEYDLSPNWEERHGIYVPTEERSFQRMAEEAVMCLRLKLLDRIKQKKLEELQKETDEANMVILLDYIRSLDNAKTVLATRLGRTVLK